MATFTAAGPLVDEAQEIVRAVMPRYHQGLQDCGTTVACLMWVADEDREEPAIKQNGHAVRARIRTTPLRYRKLGVPDLQIDLDADWWGGASRRQQEALIDHELSHRAPAVDRDGNVKRDDHDRPQHARVDHDHEHGWFDAVARHYGEASGEVEQFRAFDEHRTQQWLFDEPEEEDEEPEDDAATLKIDQRRAARLVARIARA